MLLAGTSWQRLQRGETHKNEPFANAWAVIIFITFIITVMITLPITRTIAGRRIADLYEIGFAGFLQEAFFFIALPSISYTAAFTFILLVSIIHPRIILTISILFPVAFHNIKALYDPLPDQNATALVFIGMIIELAVAMFYTLPHWRYIVVVSETAARALLPQALSICYTAFLLHGLHAMLICVINMVPPRSASVQEQAMRLAAVWAEQTCHYAFLIFVTAGARLAMTGEGGAPWRVVVRSFGGAVLAGFVVSLVEFWRPLLSPEGTGGLWSLNRGMEVLRELALWELARQLLFSGLMWVVGTSARLVVPHLALHNDQWDVAMVGAWRSFWGERQRMKAVLLTFDILSGFCRVCYLALIFEVMGWCGQLALAVHMVEVAEMPRILSFYQLAARRFLPRLLIADRLVEAVDAAALGIVLSGGVS